LIAMRQVEVRSRGLVGWFFTPDDGRHPGVLALSGSDGGCPLQIGRLLADEGFACLALQYFKADGLPKHLVEIPLEYTETALGWLSEQSEVNDSRLGVVGPSKGAELALLTAAYFPDAVGAVVAYAPSSVAFAGIGGTEGRRRSSWTYRGAPVPFVPYPVKMRPALGLRGVSFTPVYRAALENSAAVEAAGIPIEHTDVPILLISGDRDRMWPSSTMAEQLVARLASAGKSDQISHLRFRDAGHSFMPWRPGIGSERIARMVDGVRLTGIGGFIDLGGRPKANRAALHQAWPQVLSFLRRHET
jgi:dienelactone hydrolase